MQYNNTYSYVVREEQKVLSPKNVHFSYPTENKGGST